MKKIIQKKQDNENENGDGGSNKPPAFRVPIFWSKAKTFKMRGPSFWTCFAALSSHFHWFSTQGVTNGVHWGCWETKEVSWGWCKQIHWKNPSPLCSTPHFPHSNCHLGAYPIFRDTQAPSVNWWNMVKSLCLMGKAPIFAVTIVMAHPIAKNAYSCRCHMGVTNLHGSVPETPPILFNVQLNTHFYPLMCVQFPKGFSIWLRLLVLSDNGGVDQNFPIEMAKKWPWLGVSAPLAIKTTPCQHLVTGDSFHRSQGFPRVAHDLSWIVSQFLVLQPANALGSTSTMGAWGVFQVSWEATLKSRMRLVDPQKRNAHPHATTTRYKKNHLLSPTPLLQIACSTNSIKTCFYKKQ